MLGYQRDWGLYADGEVGPNTWNSLRDKVYFSGFFTDIWSYYNVKDDGFRFVFQSSFPSNWLILITWPAGYRDYAVMTVNGGMCYGS